LGYRHLHITGGEPLLWNGLPGILDYVFAIGYRSVFLNTNGLLLTARIGRELAAYGGLAVSVSLEGPRRLHEAVRGTGSYDRALEGIANAANARLPVYVFTSVGRRLLPELPSFAEGLFKDFPDIRHLTVIQLIRVPSDVFDLSGELLRPNDFLRLVCTISLLNLYGLRVDILNNPLAAVASRVLGLPRSYETPSLYRPGSLMITADGHVTLAHSTTNCFGMYEPGILSDVIGSDQYQQAVSEDRLVCKDCVHSPLCRMEGMVRPSEWYTDMFPQIPYCRRVLSAATSDG
jgi:MoaA/NifB/PqqE/SkfB family radical SAM enzyme